MDVNVYSLDEISNEAISIKVKNKESFTIEKIDNSKFSDTVKVLEKIIEDKGLKCRIYTIGRIAAVGAVAVSGWATVAGIASGLAIGAHNIATWSPDYEIAKSPLTQTVYVQYKK